MSGISNSDRILAPTSCTRVAVTNAASAAVALPLGRYWFQAGTLDVFVTFGESDVAAPATSGSGMGTRISASGDGMILDIVESNKYYRTIATGNADFTYAKVG